MFIYPMWDNESQRIGKQKCTPVGSALHVIAELFGFGSMILLLAILCYLAYRAVTANFHGELFWLLAWPLGSAVVGDLLYACSWKLAARRRFRYDDDSREASWVENGIVKTYKFRPSPDDPSD